jgi:hypothetical protein
MSSTRLSVNAGARPATLRSDRSSSPSWWNASLRMCSIRAASDCQDATVKSHARYRLPRLIPAPPSLRKSASKCAARASVAVPSRYERKAAPGASSCPLASFMARSATMYRCPSRKFFAGRMSSVLAASAAAPLPIDSSSSVKIGQRRPVAASITTTGASLAR